MRGRKGAFGAEEGDDFGGIHFFFPVFRFQDVSTSTFDPDLSLTSGFPSLFPNSLTQTTKLGERLSPWVAIGCFAMAVQVLFGR